MTTPMGSDPLAQKSTAASAKSAQGNDAVSISTPIDSLQLYRRQIPEQLLDPGQVRCLARRVAEARDHVAPHYQSLETMSWQTRSASEAKRRLIEANLRLVLVLAKRYRGFGVDLLDLIQEGNLGLMHAVEKYDYRRGHTFSTYAMWWIRHYMARAVIEQAHAIALPLYKVEELNRLKRAQRELEQRLTHEPTLEELATTLEMSAEETAKLLATPQEILSIDQQRSHDNDEATLRETLAADSTLTPEYLVERKTIAEHLRAALTHLPVFERQVIELRYGLNEDGFTQKALNLTETGDKLQKSHEAVRLAEIRALHKLRVLCQPLHVYLEP